MEKRKFLTLLGLKLQPLGHPDRSQSLYQLRYPGSLWFTFKMEIQPGYLEVTVQEKMRSGWEGPFMKVEGCYD
jgi:hypothetical protein